MQEDAEWIKWQERFSSVYDALNYSGGLQHLLMVESHRLVEKYFKHDERYAKILEIGAGCGEHAQFVRHEFDEYHLSDINWDVLAVAKNNLDMNEQKNKYYYSVQDKISLSYDDNEFDRIIAVHVLEHIYRPHLALLEWKRVIKNAGVLSVLIPCDPGILWRLGRIFARRKLLKMNMDYDYIMAREHVNPCNNLIALIKHTFPNCKATWWPTHIPSMDINLFCAIHVVVQK